VPLNVKVLEVEEEAEDGGAPQPPGQKEVTSIVPVLGQKEWDVAAAAVL
jgi:hypothetical protein